MPNIDQAPTLIFDGSFKPANGDKFILATKDFISAITSGIGSKDAGGMKIMLFLICQDGTGKFKVPHKTAEQMTQLSKPTYYSSRKKLIDNGWVTLDERNNELIVNINLINDWYTETRGEKENSDTVNLLEWDRIRKEKSKEFKF